jgi:imidazolonepropionase-like amidohydrolase
VVTARALCWPLLAVLPLPWLLSHHASPVDLVIRHVSVIDVTSGLSSLPTDIVIDGGRILSIQPTATVQAVTELDGTGLYAIPGLIDTHVHLTVPFYPDRLAEDLRDILRDGVTSIREMGGDLPSFLPLASASSRGDSETPRIFYSALMASEEWFLTQHFPASFAAGHRPWSASIGPSTLIPAVIRDAVATGATGIKITSGITPAQLRALATAAHASGLRVWSHAAVHPGRPSDAVDAGVDVLSHATLLAWEAPDVEWSDTESPGKWVQACAALERETAVRARLFQQMRTADTLLEPTLAASRHLRPGRKKSRDPIDACGTQLARDAHEAGVRLISGTDYFLQEQGHATLHKELQMLVSEAGLRPVEALQAATTLAAKALGYDKFLGRLEPGFAADVVLLTEDPTIRIENTPRIRAVIKAGRVYAPQLLQ